MVEYPNKGTSTILQKTIIKGYKNFQNLQSRYQIKTCLYCLLLFGKYDLARQQVSHIRIYTYKVSVKDICIEFSKLKPLITYVVQHTTN